MIVNGPEGYLKGHMEHDARRGLGVYMDKHNKYSTMEAHETIRHMQALRDARRRAPGDTPPKSALDARLMGTPLQRRRWVKHVLYPRLPARWLLRFLFMYVLRLGFLDGLTGLRFCLFMSAYELLIDLKIIDMRRTGAGLPAAEGVHGAAPTPARRIRRTTRPAGYSPASSSRRTVRAPYAGLIGCSRTTPRPRASLSKNTRLNVVSWSGSSRAKQSSPDDADTPGLNTTMSPST